MQLIEYPDRDLLFLGLADRITSELAETLRRKGRATLAVPGGTTPGPLFDTLSGVSMDWEGVAVLLTDERWVPETAERSNARLVRQRLIRGAAAGARLLPLHAPSARPEDAVPALIGVITPHLPVSVLLLGMGNDMHTASLFPGAEGLADALAANAPVLMVMRPPGQPEPRVTLTAPVLRAAENTHILIIGAEKRAAIERARSLAPDEAPVRTVLDHATVHWAE